MRFRAYLQGVYLLGSLVWAPFVVRKQVNHAWKKELSDKDERMLLYGTFFMVSVWPIGIPYILHREYVAKD